MPRLLAPFAFLLLLGAAGCGTADSGAAMHITGANQVGLGSGELFHARFTGRNLGDVDVVVEAVQQGEFHEIGRGRMSILGDTDDGNVYFYALEDVEHEEQPHRFALGGTGRLKEGSSSSFPPIEYTIPAEYRAASTGFPKETQIDTAAGTIIYQQHYKVAEPSDKNPVLVSPPLGGLDVDAATLPWQHSEIAQLTKDSKTIVIVITVRATEWQE